MYSVPLSGTQQSGLISIGTNISSDNASIANASITSLSVVDFKTAVFSPHTINTSNLNVSSISLDPNFVFPVLNVSTLNSVEEIFVNVSAVNISANQITADNIQPLLTAGENISIDSNNVITALNNNLPATGNFTTLNTSQINASNLSTGDLTFGSDFTLSDKFLTVNSTNSITQNSGDLITSGAVFEAFNRFGTNISDGRSLINTKLIAGGDVIKPIVSGTTNIIDVDVDPGTSKNIMKVFYTTKLGQDAMLGVVANFAYVVSGTGSDAITARLEYNDGSSGNQNIGQAEQRWRDGQGGGTRSGVLSPRIGTRKSNVPAQTQVFFQIIIDNTFSNDTFTFLNPDACTFQITESLDNDGSDLNLNTGILQANAGTFNSLTVQPGSRSGQATIGKTFLGNNAFGNMAALSVIGNTNATNYGFAQVAAGNTIMNAMPGSYNSFRSSNNEIASIGDIGLGIALGVGNTASFPLQVSGSALFSGVVFAGEFDSNEADITNLSNTNLSGTNATFQEINVSGNLIVNGTTFTTATLTAGENINISNNVISAFFGSGGQVNLNYIQVDGGVDIGGVLNVSQTSNFSNSLNVGDILYAGVAGNHEGSVVLYSNIVGDNYTTKINSSTGEVNSSATGNLNSINFFIGNNRPLEIKNFGIEVTNLQADDITSDTLTTVEAEADVFTCIDGRATFRFNTPQLNASNASIDVGDIGIINSSVVTCDVLDTDDLELITLNVSTGNVSILGVDELTCNTIQTLTLDASTLITSPEVDATLVKAINVSSNNVSANTANINNLFVTNKIDGLNINSSAINASTMIIDNAVQGVPVGLEVRNSTAVFRDINVSSGATFKGGFVFIGDSASPSATRLGFYSTDPTGNIGLNVGVNSDNHAEISIPNPTFNGVEVFNINFSAFDVIQLDNVSTRINNDLVVGNVSVGTLNISQQMNISKIDTTTITSDNTNTFNFNLSDKGVGQSAIATTFERSTNTTVTSIAGDFIFDMNPNSTAKSMIIRANGTTETRGIQNVGTIETRNFSVDENVSVTGSLSANTINVTGTLTANNIAGYQEELTAGSNISLVNNVISAIVDEFPSNANFSSVIADTITGQTLNTSNINTSFFTCIDEAGFSGTLNGNIISCNGLDSDEALFGVVASFQYNISNNLDDTEASTFIRNGNLTEFIHTGGRLRFSCNELQTSGVANFSTLNASNLSTATMGFTPDFTFDTFSNTLSLATNASQAIADIETNGLVTTSVNTSSLNVDGITTLDVVAVSLGLSSTTNNLFNINSSGTANISVINNSTINSKTGNFSSLSVFGLLGAQNVTIPGTLNATNIPGFQKTVVAGVNMSIVNNVVFTLPSVNFSTINSSVINGDTANISVINSSTYNSFDGNFSRVNISKDLFFEGSDSFFGSPSNASNNFGGPPRSRLNFWSSANPFSMGTRFGVNENNEAFLSLEPFGGVSNYTININNVSTMNMTEFETTFNHPVNASVINGDNLSTASLKFTNDFNFSNNLLSLATNASQAIADIETNGLVTTSINTSGLNVDGITTLDIVAVSVGLNSTNNNLFNINSSGTANISVINNSTLNSKTGNFSTINASSIVGYQETLIAGDNISIVGNTISSTGGGATLPANANFSSVNTSTLNASTITTSGDVNIGGGLTTPNRIRFSAYRTTSTTISNAPLIYNAISFNVGSGYNTTTGIFTAPIAGTYYFTCSYYCRPNNFNEVQFRLNGGTLVEVMRIGVTSFNNSKNNGTLLIDLQANDEISILCTQGTMQLIGAPIPINIFAGYLIG